MTFFGETIQQSSRAFWDGVEDIDDDLSKDSLPTFRLHIVDNSIEKKSSHLIIATDFTCTGFVSSCLGFEKSKLVATIEKQQDNDWQQAGEIYQIKAGVLVMKFPSYFNAVNANDVLLLIAPWVSESKDVVVLVSNPIGEYSTTNRNKHQVSFCRSLKTKEHKNDVLCPFLECPNTVFGLSAAVLSWCEFKKLPCVLYNYYYSSPAGESFDIAPLTKLFQNFNWYKEVEANKSKETAGSIIISTYAVVNSNLYL